MRLQQRKLPLAVGCLAPEKRFRMLTAYVRPHHAVQRASRVDDSTNGQPETAAAASSKERAISTTRKRHRGGFQIMRGEANGMAARNIRSYVPSLHAPPTC